MSPGEPVTLGGRTVRLEVPASYSTRSDIAFYGDEGNPRRLMAAALGVCLRGPGRVPVRYAAHGCDPMRYGGAVLDALVERGVPESEIWPLARDAFALVVNSVVSQQEVKEAEGNSEDSTS